MTAPPLPVLTPSPTTALAGPHRVSIVVLTYNRRDSLKELLDEMASVRGDILEIIVVDNCSSDGTAEMLRRDHPGVRHHRTERNRGVCARNDGLERARGEIVITLDDDILGLDRAAVAHIVRTFREDEALGALNFRVVDHFSGATACWVHHRPIDQAPARFETYEITEGAVAFRAAALRATGGYYEEFFISHEGPDLAFRLMNAGYRVAYDGSVTVRHKHEERSREPWRFYYYDTRNQIWLAARNMPAGYAARYLFTGLAAMLVYAIRDGYLGWWWRGVRDGLARVGRVRRTRRPWSATTAAAVRRIDRQRPGFWTLLRARVSGPANRLDR
ncbi:MAG: glycosyltransferase [Candidatus Eisenbacteria bacterium]